ncbi:hypothetical protein [Williamsia muralis]|uniref:DNA lyase n=1 Tax=Williamsia marianensis TaxID=85044 RepID=A0A2G3PRN5_WILMA|nr:hypothetical protein [Williamsia marianensis]PHV68465.1 hypothetical protein CSW57_04410 [Williamsia marianensis]
MASSDDVRQLLHHVRATGLEPKESARGWNHIGAIICDAALQRQAKYKSTVLPRVQRLIKEWPDADTLSGFKTRIASEGLSKTINWRGPQKLEVITRLVEQFDAAGIETVADLVEVLADQDRGPEFRGSLRRIPYVGQKTVDYIAVLAGSAEHVPVDMHIKGFAKDAGITYSHDYDRVSELVKAAAKEYGCSTGALDAAIWDYMSTQGKA